MMVSIFSHESDLDGVYSAAIGLIRYPQARIVFLNYSKDSFMRMRNFIETGIDSNKESLVVITDLGLNADSTLIDLCKDTFSLVQKNNSRVLWIDHHPWSEQLQRSTSHRRV